MLGRCRACGVKHVASNLVLEGLHLCDKSLSIPICTSAWLTFFGLSLIHSFHKSVFRWIHHVKVVCLEK